MRLPRLSCVHACILVLAATATCVRAHGDESHPAKLRKDDVSQVEQRAFGREGDPAKVDRAIQIAMGDAFRFEPAEVSIQRGETIRFVITNHGQLLHEMVLGTADALKEHAALMRRFPNMEHADANMAHVRPGAQGEIIWQFNTPGVYQFACLIPGHYEAGMVGQVRVQ